MLKNKGDTRINYTPGHYEKRSYKKRFSKLKKIIHREAKSLYLCGFPHIYRLFLCPFEGEKSTENQQGL